MPLRVETLRKWFAVAAILTVAVVAGFYGYAKWRVRSEVRKIPEKLGINVEQSTEGFKISKSEGGRTLFTVSAKKAVRFKGTGRAELHDVNIIVYGRKADRFDQIYGAKFVYEPETGDVRADGEVHIDLEAYEEGPKNPDQSLPRESKNPIHLKTSDLIFNQKTGFAATTKRIEFRLPQANGTAVGATYDSTKNELTLQSAIEVTSRGAKPATMVAQHGVLTGDPRQAVFQVVQVKQGTQTFQSDRATVSLRGDNSIERIVAAGNVHGTSGGRSASEVRAQQAEFVFGERNTLQTATVSGNVNINVQGEAPLRAQAARMVMSFGGSNELQSVRAFDGVQLEQTGAQAMKLNAPGLEMAVRRGREVQRAVTTGESRLEIAQRGGKTTVTAAKFEAEFGQQNRLRTLVGTPAAKIVDETPGQPARTSESRKLTVQFTPRGNEIASIVQEGDVRYSDGVRTASADRVRYAPAEEALVATGSPRMTQQGATVTANTLRFNRKSGDAAAEGEVKTTYTDVKAQPGGAMFAGSDPIHVTAANLVFTRANSTARYTGGARLWQGANIVQAPTLEFNQERRSLVAQGTAREPVTTVFVQPRQGGQPAPIRVNAARLTYADEARRAIYEGGVTVKGADGTVTAEKVTITLAARGQKGSGAASEVEKVIAEGGVVIDQGVRRAEGGRLEYTGADGKFVLTGSQGKSPSIFDAELGKVTGDSLTFYSRDDRVLVGSGQSSRTVTQTRVKGREQR